MADLIFVALFLSLVFTPLSTRLLGDAGIGWHIRAGQRIMAAHAIPRVDSFSSTMQGRPWFAWEWLYDVVAGQLEAAAGLNGVTWLTAVIIGGVFAWTFRILLARGIHLLIALVLVLLAISAAMIHFLARPHVVNWWFTLAWFWILVSTERSSFGAQGELRRRWLWVLPVLMAFWVNVHGGFLLGFVLLGIFWVGSLWTWFGASANRIEESLKKIAAGKRAWSLFCVGLVSAAASLLNPYGWKLHEHIYSYLSNRFLMDHIEEFQSPNFHGVAQRCFLVLLLIAVAALAARGRKLQTSELLTALLAVFAGLYSSRNIPLSSVLLVIVAGPLLPGILLSAQFFERMKRIESGLRGHLWPIVAVVVTFFLAVQGGRLGSHALMDAHFDTNRMPVAAVSYLEQQGMRGPILAPDYWGGYLIYRLSPGTQVVVDDRHDLYGAAFFQSYLRMMHVEPGWDAFLAEHRPGTVLLPRNAALADRLSVTAGWKQIYADQVSIVFAPSSASAK